MASGRSLLVPVLCSEDEKEPALLDGTPGFACAGLDA